MSVVETHPIIGAMTCDSCGVTDERTTEVRRVYVTPAAWDTEAKVAPAEGTEHWCDACLLHYPHQPIPLQPTD